MRVLSPGDLFPAAVTQVYVTNLSAFPLLFLPEVVMNLARQHVDSKLSNPKFHTATLLSLQLLLHYIYHNYIA